MNWLLRFFRRPAPIAELSPPVSHSLRPYSEQREFEGSLPSDPDRMGRVLEMHMLGQGGHRAARHQLVSETGQPSIISYQWSTNPEIPTGYFLPQCNGALTWDQVLEE